jgi:hypothetical protein
MGYLNFEVADFKSSYHAILGRVMLPSSTAIPHYTYLVLKMPTPNGVLSTYNDFVVSFRCDSEALDIATMNACVDASIILVAEVVKVAPSDLTV